MMIKIDKRAWQEDSNLKIIKQMKKWKVNTLSICKRNGIEAHNNHPSILDEICHIHFK